MPIVAHGNDEVPCLMFHFITVYLIFIELQKKIKNLKLIFILVAIGNDFFLFIYLMFSSVEF